MSYGRRWIVKTSVKLMIRRKLKTDPRKNKLSFLFSVLSHTDREINDNRHMLLCKFQGTQAAPGY